jgi:hypothetical protein
MHLGRFIGYISIVTGSIFFLVPMHGFSQEVIVFGNVSDESNPDAVINELMVVNLNTQHGFFGKANGSFQTSLKRSDTLLIGATGYSSKRICFNDSALRDTFIVYLKLSKLKVQLREVRIIAPRDLEEIEKDIRKLGYNKKDYEVSGIDAMQSPITFLYQQFSRTERLKQHNRERINEDRRRNLLKELLQKYVAWEIIDLDDNEFDYFIDYCNVSEEFMKNSTQYDFIEYIKKRYLLYRAGR